MRAMTTAGAMTVVMVLSLGACGGGGGSSAPPTTTTPVTATPTPTPAPPPAGPPPMCAGEVCLREGFRLLETDPKAALAYFTQACTDGDADGCRRVAVSRVWGNAGDAPDPTAFAPIEQLCKGGDLRACRSAVGIRLGNAAPPAITPADAAAELERLCKAGETGACLNLALNLDNGKLGVTDKGRAATILREVCTAGDKLGCFEIETIGAHPMACLDRAYELACANLGDMYADGRASCGQDGACAENLRSMACAGGSLYGCQKCTSPTCGRIKERIAKPTPGLPTAPTPTAASTLTPTP